MDLKILTVYKIKAKDRVSRTNESETTEEKWFRGEVYNVRFNCHEHKINNHHSK